MKALMILYQSVNSSYLAVATISTEMIWTMDQFHFDEIPTHEFEQRKNYSRTNLIIDYSFNSISVCFVNLYFQKTHKLHGVV